MAFLLSCHSNWEKHLSLLAIIQKWCDARRLGTLRLLDGKFISALCRMSKGRIYGDDEASITAVGSLLSGTPREHLDARRVMRIQPASLPSAPPTPRPVSPRER